ncbi:MAG: sensor histidine kinase N-terminal domain-containing protein [Betaproteobacteria bacterium]|nr:sensor histidine kinase N-terminal domain-containing protein [Betaproteobacteria bacterium]
MAVRSLRVHLLRLLLPPIAAVLAIGAVGAYWVSIDPAKDAYDQALISSGTALAERIRYEDGRFSFDLPSAAERVLRTDKYDEIYYAVDGPDGRHIAGDFGIPPARRGQRAVQGVVRYDAEYRGDPVRVVQLDVPCAGRSCTVKVAETTVKRERLSGEILASSVLPQALLAVLTLVLVWFGVARGLGPLEGLSEEIRERSPRDLRPIDLEHAPEEARPLVSALNQLFGQVAESNLNQQRFLANAAHQLRTPLAGLQAHTELALAQVGPGRSELQEVHSATIRTARLANQLLALARAEPGGYRPETLAAVDLRQVVEGAADEWVHRALDKDLDLGFDLAPASVRGDAFLLREALVNLIHNALEYTPAGGHVTVRTGVRSLHGSEHPFLEVEDDGPGIAPAERERVFERFYRPPGTGGLGSGLGLSIVREIASAHGAQITLADGGPNGRGARGCRISLIFPATPAAEEPGQA